MSPTRLLHRTLKFRLYPTPEQDLRMRSWCGAVRAGYNAALQQRQWYGRAAGTDPHGRDCRFTSVRQGRELKDLRVAFDWMRDCPADALGAALRDLDKAFDAFFVGRARYPSPRRKHENESFTVPTFKAAKASARGYFMNVVVGRDSVKLPKIGRIAWVKHARIRGSLKTATITREGDRWFICLTIEREVTVHPPLGAAIGIDVGVEVPLMSSEGEAMPYRRTPAKLSARQGRLQRELARCRRGSRRRAARRAKLAAAARLIAVRRKAQLHAVTTDLARRYGLVAIEDLAVRNMTASARGTVEEPGRNVLAKAGLNRSLLDVAPGLFRLLLSYKLAGRGGQLVAVDPRNTSRACHACGHVDADSRRSRSQFTCTACGHEDHADVNAARNILRKALDSFVPAAVVGRRKAPSEPRRRPATPEPIVSPQRAGQVPDFVNANGTIGQADRPVVTGSPAGTGDLGADHDEPTIEAVHVLPAGTGDLGANRKGTPS